MQLFSSPPLTADSAQPVGLASDSDVDPRDASRVSLTGLDEWRAAAGAAPPSLLAVLEVGVGVGGGRLTGETDFKGRM